MTNLSADIAPNCIVHARSGEVIFFEDMPYYEKTNGMYGYTVATPDSQVYFLYISYDGDGYDRASFDVVTSEYQFEHREKNG